MSDFFAKVKGLGDQLAAVGHPLEDEELMVYLLAGLDHTYDGFIASINMKGDELTIDEFYAYMLDYEMMRDTLDTSYQITANLAGRGRGDGGGGRGRGRGNGGRGGYVHQPAGGGHVGQGHGGGQ